jgi:hypothetical protein
MEHEHKHQLWNMPHSSLLMHAKAKKFCAKPGLSITWRTRSGQLLMGPASQVFMTGLHINSDVAKLARLTTSFSIFIVHAKCDISSHVVSYSHATTTCMM